MVANVRITYSFLMSDTCQTSIPHTYLHYGSVLNLYCGPDSVSSDKSIKLLNWTVQTNGSLLPSVRFSLHSPKCLDLDFEPCVVHLHRIHVKSPLSMFIVKWWASIEITRQASRKLQLNCKMCSRMCHNSFFSTTINTDFQLESKC